MKALARISCAAAVLALVFLATGCRPVEYPPTVNTSLDVCVRNPSCTAKLAVGHRGTGTLSFWAPENTIAGFETAWKMGADSVEMDPRDTIDSVPVLMHDSTVDRTTDGTGEVSQMTLAEVKALHIDPLMPEVPVQTVPTFAEALAFLHGKMLVDVDVKAADIPRLVGIIESEGMIDAAYLLIGSIQEGEEARSANPSAALMPKVANLAEIQAYLDALSPIDFFEMEIADATPEVVSFIHGQGIRLHLDALGIPDVLGKAGYADLLARGADVLQTDRLEILVPYLRGL